MSRRAILIGCPNTPGQGALRGTGRDVANYYAFLRSPVGGAWNNTEIVRMVDPLRTEVRQAVQDASDHDYVFILFSGHGSHPLGNPDQLSTRLRLEGGTMAARQLDPGNGRCTIVVDSCRTPGIIVENLQQLLTENRRVAAREPARPGRQEYRDAFDAAVGRCPEQTVYLFGCTIGETAKDDANLGGLFPRTLITRAIAWERNRTGENATFKVNSVLYKAAMLVALDSALDQIPRLTRDVPYGLYFPFAVYRS